MKAALALLLAPTASAAVVSLQAYNVDLNSSSVSGLSSGAFFAVQVIDSCAYVCPPYPLKTSVFVDHFGRWLLPFLPTLSDQESSQVVPTTVLKGLRPRP
jgi:hypothetical protein